jgi:hypothetical protein
MSFCDQDLAARLDAFLASRGGSRQMLVSAASHAFGSPLLVAATGSVIQGFGNRKSDLDVNVIVNNSVTRLPVPLPQTGFLLDATYFSASEVETWPSRIRDETWWLTGEITRELWRRRVTELTYWTRFRNCVLLSACEPWNRWITEFQQPWMVSRIAAWWRLESLRRRLGAQWLADAKPLLAAQRRFEAILAALESRAATRGLLYFGQKWLSEKLRVLNDHEGLDILREFMKLPVSEQEAREYSTRCERWLAEFGDGRQEHGIAQLWYLPGVKVRELDDRLLVSRWNLRAAELKPASLRTPDLRGPLWEGELDSTPPPDVLGLFISDMTWLSIAVQPT